MRVIGTPQHGVCVDTGEDGLVFVEVRTSWRESIADTANLRFTPDEARKLAAALIDTADEIENDEYQR